MPLGLDVTDRDAGFAAVKLAADYFARLDVTAYDAGCGQFGMVEEISEAEIRAQLETNLVDSPNRRCAFSWARRRPRLSWPTSLQLAAIGPVRLAGPANGRWPR